MQNIQIPWSQPQVCNIFFFIIFCHSLWAAKWNILQKIREMMYRHYPMEVNNLMRILNVYEKQSEKDVHFLQNLY